MSFADERQGIELRFQTGWGSTTPVKYENVAFTEPKDGPWVFFHIASEDGKQVSLGPVDQVTHRHLGVIVIQVFALKDTGTNDGKLLADQAGEIFRSADFRTPAGARIVCKTPSLEVIGVGQGWYQINVRVPYFRDVVNSN